MSDATQPGFSGVGPAAQQPPHSSTRDAGSDVTLYRAARIHTLTSDTPEALAVQAGRIVATGQVRELRQRFPHASVVDYGNDVIVPGFNDAHMHLMSAADEFLSVD